MCVSKVNYVFYCNQTKSIYNNKCTVNHKSISMYNTLMNNLIRQTIEMTYCIILRAEHPLHLTLTNVLMLEHCGIHFFLAINLRVFCF